jgi:hypothetical protein
MSETESPSVTLRRRFTEAEILAEADNDEQKSWLAELILYIQGGSIKCALPNMLQTDEEVVRMCGTPEAIAVAGGFLGLWALLVLVFKKTIFQKMGYIAYGVIWVLAAGMTYAVYEVVLFSHIFEWRRNQLFLSVAMEDPKLMEKISPWRDWRQTLHSDSTNRMFIVGTGILICAIVALALAPKDARTAWVEGAQNKVVGRAKETIGVD